MERYDAILEQLKKAQSRGMENFSNRLDFVVQSLEELIQEAKTTVQEALPQTAGECFPTEEIEAAINAFREDADAHRQRADALDLQVGDLEREVEEAQKGAPIELIRALDGARSQSELLKELLPAISEYAARAVVLVLRDGRVSAWSGIGFADGELLRAWQGDVAESPALTQLLEKTQPVSFEPADDGLILGWLGDQAAPGEVLLIPVVLRGKLMGAIYIDRLEDHPWNPEPAQALVAQVCWLIDTLQYRPEPTPALIEPAMIERIAEVQELEEPPVVDEAAPEFQEEAIAEEPGVEDETEETAAPGDVTIEDEPVEEDTALEVEDEVVDEEPEPVDESTEDETTGDDQESQEEDETETPDEDPSATMKIDVSGMEYADEIADGHETEESPEIASESFEPGEPSAPPPDFEAVAETEFEPEEPTQPTTDFEAAPETEFEPETEEVEDVTVDAEEAPAPPGPETVPTQVQMPVTPPDEPEEEKESQAAATGFLDEPPPVQPVQPPPDEPEEEVSEDEAQQEEARRFARLLVSEIKLYNEEQVEHGRESADLYHRLKEDIDRSREMFDKRISAEVREKQDYFTDELVRILADGNADLLGM